MNILVTINNGYIHQLCVMLHSLYLSDTEETYDVYIMNVSLTKEELTLISDTVKNYKINIYDIKISESGFKDAPITDRYPLEIYYRIFASYYLPKYLDKILYLDPDLVVLQSVKKLYDTDIGDNYYAAASHVGNILRNINELRLKMTESGPYINSGVMLMNLNILRKEQNVENVYEYIKENRKLLMLPDQDIISGLYSDKIYELDPYIYNMTEKLLRMPIEEHKVTTRWICENSVIIHYCGRNKPWKQGYIGKLDIFYHQFDLSLKKLNEYSLNEVMYK